jgi:hypothetical protein
VAAAVSTTTSQRLKHRHFQRGFQDARRCAH